MNSKLACALFCASVLAGGLSCYETGKKSRPSIVGGQPTAKDSWLSAVALLSYQSVDCSGVLVHPQLVITAAHCVLRADETLKVYLGTGHDKLPLQGQGAVARLVPSPNFGPGPHGYHDIAYILLQEPLVIDSQDLVPLLSSPEELSEVLRPGQPVRIVGFGEREDKTFGSKYEATVTIASWTDTEVKMGGDGIDACRGDSGGPAYVQLKNGDWRVLGVVSRGRACGQGGIWTRVDPYLCWIEAHSGIDLDLPAGICEPGGPLAPPA